MVQEDRATNSWSRQSIWSVPGHLWRWYVVLFVLQYFGFLGLTIWDEVARHGGIGAVEITLNVQKGMTASILNMAASTYIVLEGVMLAQWLRDRDHRKREEGLERAREEVEARWTAWYERMQAAKEQGLPFDEPPPMNEEPTRKD